MRKRIGRPPAGTRPGEKVSQYPQISLRLPPEIKETLGAISRVQRKPQWRVVIAAIDCYLGRMTANEREFVRKAIPQRRS